MQEGVEVFAQDQKDGRVNEGEQPEEDGNAELKEAYRLFFMVKGHMDCTPKTALSCANGYFKRLWYAGANGAPLYDYDSDFNVAWEKYINDKNK